MEPVKIYKKLRKLRDVVDDLMLEILEDVPYKEVERDFDVIAVGKSKAQKERIKSIRDIIKEIR